MLQIGSAKGVARLMQRAGRSGHAPGRPSRVTLVPTHSLELVEAAAAREAVAARQIEARRSPALCMDVLVQHLVSMALGAGFRPAQLLEEVRSTWAYRHLRDEQWQWALEFVRNGGASLGAYLTITGSSKPRTGYGGWPTRAWRVATAWASAPSSAMRASS